MAQNQQVKPLRTAASLIINRGNQGQQMYQILTLVRKPHMSFANSVVFPGGACEPIDDKYLQSNNFSLYSKITAVRQTVEQSGILLLPPSVILTRLNEFRGLYKEHKFAQIEEYIAKTWSEHLQLIKPILRLATPQFKKMKRYDCIFYVLDQEVKKINLGAHDDLDRLDISISESKEYFWKQPVEYLSMFTQGNLQLPFPQQAIFSALEHIQSLKLNSNTLYQDKYLVVEPLIFNFSTNRSMLLAGDHEYQYQQTIETEPQSRTSNQIKSFLSKVSIIREPKARRRIVKGQTKQKIAVHLDNSSITPQQSFFKYLPTIRSKL